jgi:molecular chaperone DnaJ
VAHIRSGRLTSCHQLKSPPRSRKRHAPNWASMGPRMAGVLVRGYVRGFKDDMEDPCAVLGMPCMVPAEDIGPAHPAEFRHHPDVNSGKPEVAEHLERVMAACAVLSDEDQRDAHDDFGESAAPGGNQAEAQTSEFDLGDLFAMGLGGTASVDAVGGTDRFAVVWLDLAQAIQGALVSVDVPLAECCHDCLGTGRDPRVTPETCPQCQGTGQQQVTRGSMRFVATCPRCHGQAEITAPCPTCRGRGHRYGLRSVTVRTPPGADDGSILRISGQGAPGQRDDPPGDLVIKARVRPHPLFRRDGLDLHLSLPVTLDEAYNGADLVIPTFDGRVRVLIPAGSQSGSQLRLRGKGIARGSERGDLYVEVDVRLPERYDEALALALRAASSAYIHPVRKQLRL